MAKRLFSAQMLCASALAAAFIFAFPHAGSAHTIPDDVKVQAFVKPEGNRLYLLVRVPAETGTDVLFPEHENNILDPLNPLLADE